MQRWTAGSAGNYLALQTDFFTGLLLRVVAEPATALDGGTPLRWLLPFSGALQFGAACAFVALIWPRVKER